MVEYELEPLDDESYELEPAYDLEPIDEPVGLWDRAASFGAGLAHTARAVAETGAGLATGLAAFPISKGTKWIEYALTGGDLEKAKAAEEKAARRIQFEPTTEEARGALDTIGKYVLDPVFGTLREMGRLPGESWKSPTMSELGGDIAEIGGPVAIGAGIKAGIRSIKAKGKPRESYGPIEETPPEFLREAPVEAAKEIIPERPIPEEIIPERPVPAEEVKLAPERIETKQYVLEPVETGGKQPWESVLPEEFITSRNKTTRPEYLTPYTPEALSDMTTKKLSALDVGYAVKTDGDIVNVFNNAGKGKDYGSLAVIDAIRNGGTKLDAFDGYLTKFYKDLGFKEVKRDPFADEYAPEGWVQKYGVDNKPDIVYMEYGGKKNDPTYAIRSFEANRSRKLGTQPGGTELSAPKYGGIGTGTRAGLDLEKPEISPRITQGSTQPSLTTTPETLEVMVKGGSTGELPKYAEGSSINLERLDTTQDIKQFQNILTKAAEEKIGKRQVSWEETTKAAEDLAWDDKEFLKQAKKKGGFSAAEIDAMRQINTNALHDLFNTIQEMPADYMKRTPESRLAVLDKLNNYVEVMKETSMKSSEAGRALNIHKKMIQDNPEFAESAYQKQVLQQMMDALGGREMTDAMIDDLRGVNFKDPKAVRDVIQKYHQSGLFDKIYEVWLNSILSAPASHAANILGNTLAIMTKVPESAVKDILSGKSPVGAIRAESVGLWQGMKDGVRAAAKAFQSGVPADMLTKVEHQRYSAIPGKTGEVIRIPTRALTAADEFFKAIIYRAEANLQAYNIARNEGLSGTPMAERMTKIINDAQDPSFLDVHTKARNESLYRTFNKPLGNMGQGVMRLRDRVPGLRYVIPFIRTPMNIAKFALERTPLNFGKILYEYKTGKLSPSELNAELAKPIVGSLIAAATVMNVLEGNISGAPPKNKKDRDLLYSTGWQPYSLKIGKQYVSYSRLEPIGSLVGVTADFVSAMQDDDSEINERAGNIIMSFSRNIASKTFLQGVSGMLDAISDPERYGGSYVEKMAGSVVPSIVGAGARAIDPYVRDVETPLEAIRARIPGLSGSLPVKVGAFEMPIERPGGAWSRFLSPIQISESRPDMEIIAGAEINEREMERKLTKLQKKTMRELLRQSRIR